MSLADILRWGEIVFPVVGYRGSIDPHWGSSHAAADLFAPRGTPVVAMRDGVATAGTDPVGGNWVLIQGDDGLLYYYAHLDRPGRSGRVRAGEVIGYVGDSGNARGTGPHLHIGIGHTITSGTGPNGGGGDIDVTSLLRAIKDNVLDSVLPDEVGAVPVDIPGADDLRAWAADATYTILFVLVGFGLLAVAGLRIVGVW